MYQDNQLLSHYLGQTCWEPKTVWTKCSAEDMSWPWASLQDSVTSLSLSRQTQLGTGLSVTTPPWFSISQLALPCKTTHRMQKCCDTFWFRKLYRCCYSTTQHLQHLMQHLMKKGLIIHPHRHNVPCTLCAITYMTNSKIYFVCIVSFLFPDLSYRMALRE